MDSNYNFIMHIPVNQVTGIWGMCIREFRTKSNIISGILFIFKKDTIILNKDNSLSHLQIQKSYFFVLRWEKEVNKKGWYPKIGIPVAASPFCLFMDNSHGCMASLRIIHHENSGQICHKTPRIIDTSKESKKVKEVKHE